MRIACIILSVCCAAALAQGCGALERLPEKGADLPVKQKENRTNLFGQPAKQNYEMASRGDEEAAAAPELPEYEIDYEAPPPSEATGAPPPEPRAAAPPETTETAGAAGAAETANGRETPELSAPAARVSATIRILDTALMYYGAPYKWGGESPDGVDCSGLVCAAYRAAGMQLPRTSPDQAAAGRVVKKDEIRPGDLLFFEASRKGVIGHSALVVEVKDDSVKFIHATPSGGVRFDFLEQEHWQTHFVTARRYY